MEKGAENISRPISQVKEAKDMRAQGGIGEVKHLKEKEARSTSESKKRRTKISRTIEDEDADEERNRGIY